MAWNFVVQFLFYIGSYVVSALLNKATQPGTPQPGEVQFPRADPEAPIPVIYGTTRVGLNVVHKVQVQTGENTVRGSAPFGWSPQHIGYFYYIDALAVVGWGPFSSLHDVIVDGTKSLKAIGTVPTFDGFGSDFGSLYISSQTISSFPPSEPDDRGSVYTITAGNILGGKFERGGVGAGSEDAASAGVMRVTRGTGLPIHNARFEGLVGSDLPTYPKLITVAFESFYMGNSEQLPSIELVIARVPPTSSLLMGGTLPNSGRDANPAAILHDLLINTDYGLGLPPSDLDSTSLGNMGSALDTVSGGVFDLGMSFVLAEQVSAKTVIQDLLRTVDGVLYVHPTTGLLNVRLLRAAGEPFYGYDGSTIVNESSIIDGTFSWSESAADATVNEVKVEFVDRSRGFVKNVATVRNVAAIHALGRVESRTVSFLGIQDYATAVRLAQRELKAVSAVLGHGTFEMDRTATTFTPAQPFTLSFAPFGIAGKTVRVLTVRDTPHGTVALEVVEDVYATSAPSFTTVVPDEPTPIGDPAFVRPNVVPTYEVCNGNGIGTLAVYDPESAVTAVEFTEDGGVTWHAAVNPVPPCYTGPASQYVNLIPKAFVDVYAGWRVTYTDASGNTETLEGNFPTLSSMDRLPAPVLRWSVSGGTVTVTASWNDTFTPDLYLYASGAGFVSFTSGDTPVTSPYQISFAYPAPGAVVYVSAVRRYLTAQYTVEQESDYAYETIVGAPTGGVTGGGSAPDSADYLVKTANGTLSAERVVTDTSTVTWDWATSGQAKAQIPSSVALAGSPTTTTQSPGDNSTKIATTAYVDAASGGSGAPATADYLVKTANGSLSAERVVTDTTTIETDWSAAGQAKIKIVSSAPLPGSPTTTTQSPNDNSTKLATTAYVDAAVATAPPSTPVAGAAAGVQTIPFLVAWYSDATLKTIPSATTEIDTRLRRPAPLQGMSTVRLVGVVTSATIVAGTVANADYSIDGGATWVSLAIPMPLDVSGVVRSDWAVLPDGTADDILVRAKVSGGNGTGTAKLAFLALQASPTTRAGGGTVTGGGAPGGTIYDDEFTYGSVLDTAGARFTSAIPWTKENVGPRYVSANVASGKLGITGASNGGFHNLTCATMPLPSGDWTFQASVDLGALLSSDWEAAVGLMLRESSTGKILTMSFGIDYVGGSFGLYAESESYFDYSNKNTQYGLTSISSLAGLMRISRVGTTLTVEWSQNGGASWTTAHTASQTTDFTTAPSHVGVFVNPRYTGANVTGYFEYFRRTA